MIRNKDFALLYAGRAVFNKNGEYAGVVVGWNDMLGVILGVDCTDGWQTWGVNDMGVSGDGFLSYEYRNAGMLIEPVAQLEPVEAEAPKHMTIGEPIKEHEGMGDGLENVVSKI